ncbi:MAG TPA: TIM44-like domain-containing protein [Beijerinckiaceae bacterium]|jgi:predicted lipid-binding transport protein (Tim44 family)
MMNLTSRRGRAVVALAAVLTLAAGVADARPGGKSGGFGSRGSRTNDAPAATTTAPTAPRPIERTQTRPDQMQQRPGVNGAQAAQPSRGLGGGFLGGLLGAGLLGALLGYGLSGGLGGLASILGVILQVALIGGLIMLALRFFRRRQEPALAGAAPANRVPTGPVPNGPMARSALGGLAGGLGGGAAAQVRRPGVPDEIGLGPDDFASFERGLIEVQTAYGREDVSGLWQVATPEMASYFQEELNDNARQGVVNRVSNVKLLQGDLSEAWREGATDYATVAMRYALTDVTVEKATGRVVAGDAERPTEAVEIWTFRRDQGGPWKLSAIQQTA